MQLTRLVVSIFTAGAMVVGTGAASGQTYPNKPIRVFTSSAGGSSDFAARLIAQGLAGPLGQQVTVENRPGVAIVGDIVAKAAPDGYTLIYYGNTFWTLPLMRENMPYDTLKDFSPIALATIAPLILVVHPSLPVKSTHELIALAKARPGELNYASGGAGSSNHLAAELFKAMARVNIMTIQYRGSGGGVIALMGGEVQMMISSTASVYSHIKSGRLRALAVTSADPSALVPGLPTIAGSGVPGYEAAQKAAMFAPAKTPAAIIDRLNRELVLFLNRPDTKQKFFNDGVETVGSSPAELAAFVKSEMTRMGKVIRDAGIRAQ